MGRKGRRTIERVWQGRHANVTRNQRCTTMTHLLGRIMLRAS
jgi:hypothetical protein